MAHGMRRKRCARSLARAGPDKGGAGRWDRGAGGEGVPAWHIWLPV